MKVFIAISAFVILVSSDDDFILANEIGQDIINSLERALYANNVAKVSKFYDDFYILEKCGQYFSKQQVVEELLLRRSDNLDVDFKVVNGRFEGPELKFTVITNIRNQPSFAVDYTVQKSDDEEPIITYSKFITC